MSVRLPRLLNADWSEKARLHPAALPITMQTFGVSTAQMTLSEAEPAVAMHDWMELYTINGSIGLFRVTNTAAVLRKNRVLTLRHALDTFADSVWKRPDGTKLDFTGTVSAYLAAIIAQQSTVYWQLGTCEDTASFTKSGIYYTRLSELLSELEQKRKNFYFTFDFSTTPWTLNFVRMPALDGVEFRLSRNVEGCQIVYNDEQMCNRLYMTWSLDEETGAKSIRTYNNLADQTARGYVIEKTVDVREADVTDPDEWAADFLAERSEPSAKISVDGVVLYDLTGVEWDETQRGKMARVALPDYGVTVSERLLTVKYSDAINLPRKITAELSNNLDSLSSALAQIQKTASDGVSAAGDASDAGAVESYRAKASENDIKNKTGINSLVGDDSLYTLISQNEREIELRAYQEDMDGVEEIFRQAGLSINAQGVLIYAETDSNMLGKKLSTIKTTADAVELEVQTARNGETSLSSRLSITDSAIQTEVTDRTNSESNLSSRITQNATSISTEVTDRTNGDNALSSRITQNANSISLVVENGSIKSASIVAAINDAGSTVKISADHIVLDGAAVATSLASKEVTLGTITASNLTLGGTGYTGRLIGFTGINRYATFLGTADLSLAHSHSFTFNVNGGTVTATVGAEQTGNGSDSFNIAATQFYLDGVAAAKSAMGMELDAENHKIIVTEASLRSASITASASLAYNSSSHTYTATATAKAGTTAMNTGTATSGTEAYSDGVTVGKAAMGLQVDSTNHKIIVAETSLKSASITATANITYNSSTHTYTATATAKAGTTSVATGTDTSGSEAYSAGISYGYSSGYTEGQSDGYSSGYSAGQSNPDLSRFSLHVSKSQGNVYLYLNNGSGTTVKSRTASISISSFSKSSNSSTLYNITVCIDGDTYFSFSKTLS